MPKIERCTRMSHIIFLEMILTWLSYPKNIMSLIKEAEGIMQIYFAFALNFTWNIHAANLYPECLNSAILKIDYIVTATSLPTPFHPLLLTKISPILFGRYET